MRISLFAAPLATRGARSLVLLLATLALVATACSGGSQSDSGAESITTSPTASASPEPDAEIRGCVPRCSSEFADPGAIGPGPYTTVGFLDGQLTVTYPDRWESHEDQGVEFSSAPLGEFDIHRVLFWSDILPWVADARHPDGRRVQGVPNTASGWFAWLSSHPDLHVSAPRSATIGRMQLPAAYVDIAVRPGTIGFDDGAVVVLSWPNAGGNVYSFGGSFMLRLYLSDVTYGGKDHLLAIAIEGQDRADLEAFSRSAQPVIASADAPIGAAG